MRNDIAVKSMMNGDQGWHPNAPVVMEYDNNRDHRDVACHSSKHLKNK